MNRAATILLGLLIYLGSFMIPVIFGVSSATAAGYFAGVMIGLYILGGNR